MKLISKGLSRNVSLKICRLIRLSIMRETLKPFFEFLRHKSINNASELSKDVIDDYIVFMKKTRHNITTINTYLRGLRAFLNFLIKQEILEESIKLHLFKDEDKIKETYTEEDIKKLIKKPDLKRCSFADTEIGF